MACEVIFDVPKNLQKMADRYFIHGKGFRFTSRAAAVRLATRSPRYFLKWNSQWKEDKLVFEYREGLITSVVIDVARIEEYKNERQG